MVRKLLDDGLKERAASLRRKEAIINVVREDNLYGDVPNIPIDSSDEDDDDTDEHGISQGGVEVSPDCIRGCGCEEAAMHALRDCVFAKQTWLLSNIQWSVVSCQVEGVEAWLRHLCRSLPGEEFALSLVICWALWWKRNQCRHGEMSDPSRLPSFAHQYLIAFIQVWSMGS
ncbi:hypothetical protein Salat_2775700 [Sesamum alatum]|uniref:Reverse transcriptase zinc-binding domain-containing protein n=1 Tax=Sesamum alatum TaxID=300844 RepID=A0AAE2C942_9LAMI|nr:hypothetical protein Salat_2775700 [Sesamum alatum]